MIGSINVAGEHPLALGGPPLARRPRALEPPRASRVAVGDRVDGVGELGLDVALGDVALDRLHRSLERVAQAGGPLHHRVVEVTGRERLRAG